MKNKSYKWRNVDLWFSVSGEVIFSMFTVLCRLVEMQTLFLYREAGLNTTAIS